MKLEKERFQNVRGIDMATPENSPMTGQVAIATTGTPVPLSGSPISLPAAAVLIRAHSGNAAAGVVGKAGVTNTVDGSGNGFILEAGDSVAIYHGRLDEIYVNGTENDIFSFSAG